MKKSEFNNIAVLIVLTAFTAFLSGCLSTAPAVQEIDYTGIDGKTLPPGFYTYSKITNEYNDKGLLAREVSAFDEGEADLATAVYEYNEAGYAIKKSSYGSKHKLKEYEVYEYDGQMRRIKETEYRADGSLKNYKTYEYNDAENSVIKKFFDPAGILYRYSVRITDEEGRLLDEADYRK